jgi:hypothetical protein
MSALYFFVVEALLPLFFVHVAHEGHVLLDVSDVLRLLSVLLRAGLVYLLAEMLPSSLTVNVGMLENVLKYFLLFLLLALHCDVSELSVG